MSSTKKCSICCTVFVALVHNSKYCNNNCRKTAKNTTHKKWYLSNREKVSLYDKTYYLEHREERIQKDKEYRRHKVKTSSEYKIKLNLRKRLNKAISINQKSGSAIRDLGCSIEELKAHLESKFTEGMSWDNYGRKPYIRCWEIDHIIPLSYFNLNDLEEFKKACYYTNLQPLWSTDNSRKVRDDKLLIKNRFEFKTYNSIDKEKR